MALFFHHRTIRHKFSLIVILSSLAFLLLIGLLFGSFEYVSSRKEAVVNLRTLSALLETQLNQPLLNGSKIRAKQVLAALSTDNHLQAAYLFDRKNRPFVQYLDSSSIAFVSAAIPRDFHDHFPSAWLQAKEPAIHLSTNFLSLYTPIYYQYKKIGGLYLLSDLVALYQRLLELLASVLLAGGAAIGLAWGLSGRLLKPISRPILQLADTIYQVSSTDNYRLRAQKISDDEIGQLVDGFNDMLSQIEIRDQKLDLHHRSLERVVRERTAELTKTVGNLEIARKQAEAANQAKSLFLANMTHELRTPLVGVLGMNELLAESNLNSQQHYLTEAVQHSGQDLLEIINDILDFASIEGGHLSLKLEKFDLLKLVEKILTMLASRAYSKGLEVVYDVDPAAVWEVEADPQRLRQILLNLFGNAIKFTQTGHVSLRLTNSPNGRFLFEVSDTGIGIEKQDQARIFEAFFQVDGTSSRVFGGTGLGLSIAHALVRMMDGSLQLESEPGRGSIFRIELPLKRVQPSFMRLNPDRAGCSVILLEPYSPARETLQKILADLGFSAMAVASSTEFLQQFKNLNGPEVHFDLVILGGTDNEILSPELASASTAHGRTVICLQKKLSSIEKKRGFVGLLQPLLWSHLLRDDLFVKLQSDCLPTAQLKNEPLPPPVSCSTTDKKVLVVDDNIATRELIGFSLVGSDWLSEGASSMEEALAAIQRQKYLLILMDVNMPGTDGLETTRIMRTRGIDTPIFALTAHGDKKILTECLEAGMQGFLRKPFRQKELFALLEAHAAPTDRSEETSGRNRK